MEWTDLDKLIKEREGPRLEFKESPFLQCTHEIAAQLVSFANRYGGQILVGIKDDGNTEGAKIHKDKESLHILNVANDKCIVN
jgi:predicted HTH transcriptional regulator